MSNDGLYVFGPGYSAINYGEKYDSKIRQVIISGEDRSYLSRTSGDGFPDNVDFHVKEPYIPLREASHTNVEMIETTLNFDEFIEMLREGGVRFPE